MGFPIKKRANSDGDSRNGLDLLSAVIDSTATASASAGSVSDSTSTPTVDNNIDPTDDGCDEDSTMSDQHSTSTAEISSKTVYPSHKRAKTFPEVLMDILSNPDNEHIVGWLQHGKSFAIHNSTLFSTQVLPKYFRRVIFRSFIRKLNRWGFRSTKRSVSGFASTFEHKYFCRDEPELCAKIYCKSNPTRRASTKMMGSVVSSSNMHAVVSSTEDVTSTNTTLPIANAVSVAATQAVLRQARQQLPLLNTGSSLSSRLSFLNDDIQLLSRAASMNHQIRSNCATSASSTLGLPLSTKAVLDAVATQAVLNQARQLSYLQNNSHLLSPPSSYTTSNSGNNNFPSTALNNESQVQLSNELLSYLELQRQRQRQQALMSYLFYCQE